MRLIFFLTRDFSSSFFTVLSCSNLMLMSLSLGLSTLVSSATLGTLNCYVFRQEPDLMWSLILCLLALPGVPHPILWPVFYSVLMLFRLNSMLPERHPSVSSLTSWLSIHQISQLITVPPWRDQVPEMGCHWMESATIGQLGHKYLGHK